jgi:hypothetical protein
MAKVPTTSRFSTKVSSPKKSTGIKPSSVDMGARSLKSYSKAALQNPLSFGSTALLQTPSLLGMSDNGKKKKPK